MKTYRTSAGPFRERPYYDLGEIDRLCEEELNAVALLPATPKPIRIERFVEKRFKVTPRYEILPNGVLGFTVFGTGGVREIVVSRTLEESESAAANRQVRTTLAHEGGHGLLHAHLFALADKDLSLFADLSDPSRPKVLCRDVPTDDSMPRRGYDGRWWEFQANRAIGGLLLPRTLVEQALAPFQKAKGTFRTAVLDGSVRAQAVRCLAERFEVNPVVARIRIDDLYPASEENQLWL